MSGGGWSGFERAQEVSELIYQINVSPFMLCSFCINPQMTALQGFPCNTSNTIVLSIIFKWIRYCNDTYKQCCGSGSVGSVGSVCLWANLIWILLSSSKNSNTNFDSYCFVTSFWLFLSLKNDVNVSSKSSKENTLEKYFCCHLEGQWRK